MIQGISVNVILHEQNMFQRTENLPWLNFDVNYLVGKSNGSTVSNGANNVQLSTLTQQSNSPTKETGDMGSKQWDISSFFMILNSYCWNKKKLFPLWELQRTPLSEEAKIAKVIYKATKYSI